MKAPMRTQTALYAVGIGVVLAVGLGAAPAASAAQDPNWRGPPCQVGAARFVTCSNEPFAPDDPMPCYVSKLPAYVPDRIERRMVLLCQAAKAALDPTGASHDRTQKVLIVESRGTDLMLAIQADQADAANHLSSLRATAADLIRLSSRVAAYGPNANNDGDDPVSNTLIDLTNNSSVWAGTD